MSETYDVIIVGGGPAGISAAILCANNKMKTLLIDKKTEEEIGNKVCGEALSKKTVINVSKKLNVEPPKGDEIKANISTLIIQTADPEINLSLPSIGYMINRHIYGQRLLKEALKRGVLLESETKVLSPIIKDNKVSGVKVKKKNRSIFEFRSKIVIDCSGTMAVVRTNLPENFEPLLNKNLSKSDYASCFREIIKLKKPHKLDGKIVLQYVQDVPEPGYIWFFAIGKKKLNCGTGFVKEGKNEKKSVKKIYNEAMKKYHLPDSYEILDSRGDVVTVKPPIWNAVAPGLIVAGDAAFHADPLTAEGHGPALFAGCFAAEVAIKTVIEQNYSTKDLWEYNIKIMKEFGEENARYKIITLVLEKLGAKNLEFLLKRKVIKKSDLSSAGVLKKESLFSMFMRMVRSFPKIGLLLLMKKAMDANKELADLFVEYPSSPVNFRRWETEIENIYNLFT